MALPLRTTIEEKGTFPNSTSTFNNLTIHPPTEEQKTDSIERKDHLSDNDENNFLVKKSYASDQFQSSIELESADAESLISSDISTDLKKNEIGRTKRHVCNSTELFKENQTQIQQNITKELGTEIHMLKRLRNRYLVFQQHRLEKRLKYFYEHEFSWQTRSLLRQNRKLPNPIDKSSLDSIIEKIWEHLNSELISTNNISDYFTEIEKKNYQVVYNYLVFDFDYAIHSNRENEIFTQYQTLSNTIFQPIKYVKDELILFEKDSMRIYYHQLSNSYQIESASDNHAIFDTVTDYFNENFISGANVNFEIVGHHFDFSCYPALEKFLNNQTVAVKSSIKFINCEFKTHGFYRIKWDELNSRTNLNLIFDSCTMSRLMKFMWKHYSPTNNLVLFYGTDIKEEFRKRFD